MADAGAATERWREKQWTQEKWAATAPEQRQQILTRLQAGNRNRWHQTEGRTEKNRRIAGELWRKYLCPLGCACCPDACTAERNARQRQSEWMRAISRHYRSTVAARGLQFLDSKHPNWRSELLPEVER